MRLLLKWLALLFVISCGQNSQKTKSRSINDSGQSRSNKDSVTKKNNLPSSSISVCEKAVSRTLHARFGSKWQVMNDQTAHWMKEAFDYFIIPKRKQDPDYPYIAKGDFNTDSKIDTAVVVKDVLHKKYQLAILLKNDKTNMLVAVISDITRNLTYLSFLCLVISGISIFISGFSDWRKPLFIYSLIGVFIFLIIWRICKKMLP